MVDRYDTYGRELEDTEPDASAYYVRFDDYASLEQKLAIFAHTHVASPDVIDRCLVCGLDIRDSIHLRKDDIRKSFDNMLGNPLESLEKINGRGGVDENTQPLTDRDGGNSLCQ